MSNFSVSYTYKIKDLYSGPLAKIAQATDRHRKALNRINQTTKKFSVQLDKTKRKVSASTTKIRQATSQMNRYAKSTKNAARSNALFNRTKIKPVAPGIAAARGKTRKTSGVGAGIATVGGLIAASFPIKAAADFEFAMADVRKTVNFETPKQFEEIKQQIFLSSKAMGKFPVAIAGIVAEGGKLGILPKNLGGFVGIVSKSSVAFDELERVIAAQIASISKKLDIPVNKMGDMMDSINFAADNSAASGKRVVEIIARTSGIMSTIKMPKEMITGFAAFADQIEVTPQLAASGLRMMINRMKRLPGGMKRLLLDPVKAIRDQLQGLANIDPVRRSAILRKRFGDEAGRFAEKAVNKLKLLDETLALVSDKSKFAGSMNKELAIKMATATMKTRQLIAKFKVMAIQMGGELLPEYKKIVKWISSFADKFSLFAKNNPRLIKFALAATIAITALGALLIPLGFVASGLAALFSPTILIIGAITALVAGLGFLAIKNKNVGSSLFNLTTAFDPLFRAISTISGLFNNGLGMRKMEIISKGVVIFLNQITEAVQILLSPLELIADIMESIKDFGFTKTISMLGGTLMKSVAKGLFDVGTYGFDKSNNVASDNAKAVNNTLNGRIEIGVTGPGKIKRAESEYSGIGDMGLGMVP